jgi:hypothetical protein
MTEQHLPHYFQSPLMGFHIDAGQELTFLEEVLPS